MSAYTVSVIAVTVACSLVIMISSGTKHEKLLLAVASAVIAVTALAPIVNFFSSDFESEVLDESEKIEQRIDDFVGQSYSENLERNIKICVEEKFEGCLVDSVNADCTGELTVQSVTVTESGADPSGVKEYVTDLVSCDNVRVIRKDAND